MKFVNTVFTQTLEVKQSKFIAYLLPYSEYKITLEKLKLSNLKARHFVVAYRYLNEFNQVVEYSTDDGEPNGTSGKPTLYVLQGNDVINCKFHKHSSTSFTFSLPLISQTAFHSFHFSPSTF